MSTSTIEVGLDAQFLIAKQACRCGRLTEAEQRCRAILRVEPDHAETLNLLGRIMHFMGRPGIGAAFIQKALRLAPEEASFHRSFGSTLLARHRPAEALLSFERAVELEPDSPRGYALLGGALLDLDRFEESVTALKRAVALGPERAEAHNSLAVALLAQARVEEAIHHFRRAVELDPESPHHHSGLLFASHYVSGETREALFSEALRWGARHSRPLDASASTHQNTPQPDRRLRIGYLSADFHLHPVGYLIETVLLHHDADQFEVFCYSNSTRVDALTQRLQAKVDQWRSVVGMSDEEAAAMIRQDSIDLLIDLSGHTGGNRLLVTAQKPAPVQAMWLGYFDTTGINAIDYVIADERVCPPDADRWYVESIARLPQCYIAYTPPVGAPAVSELPVDRNGYVTFGCFNNLPKASAEVVEVWAEILHAVPGSRMVLKSNPLTELCVRKRYEELFRSCGISADRLTLLGKSPHPEYLAAFGEVDLALDPFPYSGGMTTVDGLWMGVPAVTLAGDRFVSRMSTSHLTAAGLPEFVTHSRGEYIERAVRAVKDRAGLRALRAGLREQVASSPLCDGPGFTRELEAAYRKMWRTWCWSRASE